MPRNLPNVVNVGDYVAYDVGMWTTSASIPTSQGQFGGYTKGKNKANNVVCAIEASSTTLKGWRFLSIDKSINTVTIMHAGSPECYYHVTNSASSIINLNDRASREYLNTMYTDSAHMMNKEEVEAINQSSNLRIADIPYWLATQNSTIYLWSVGKNGVIYCYIDHNIGGSSAGIRPVIVLKAGIKTTGKITDLVGNENAWGLVAP